MVIQVHANRDDVAYNSGLMGSDFEFVHSQPTGIAIKTSGSSSVDFTHRGCRMRSGSSGDVADIMGISEYWGLNNNASYKTRHLFLIGALYQESPTTDSVALGIGAGQDRGLYLDFENEEFVDADAGDRRAFNASIAKRRGFQMRFTQNYDEGYSEIAVRSATFTQTETFQNVRDRQLRIASITSNGGGDQVRLASGRDVLIMDDEIDP